MEVGAACEVPGCSQGELDELEREEFFRLKKVQGKKQRDDAVRPRCPPAPRTFAGSRLCRPPALVQREVEVRASSWVSEYDCLATWDGLDPEAHTQGF